MISIRLLTDLNNGPLLDRYDKEISIRALVRLRVFGLMLLVGTNPRVPNSPGTSLSTLRFVRNSSSKLPRQ